MEYEAVADVDPAADGGSDSMSTLLRKVPFVVDTAPALPTPEQLALDEASASERADSEMGGDSRSHARSVY